MQMHQALPASVARPEIPSGSRFRLRFPGCISSEGGKAPFPTPGFPPPRGYKHSGAQRGSLEPHGTGRAGSAGSSSLAAAPGPGRAARRPAAGRGGMAAEGRRGLFWGSSLAFFNQLKKIMLSVCHQAPPAIGQGWPRDQELAAISPQSRV